MTNLSISLWILNLKQYLVYSAKTQTFQIKINIKEESLPPWQGYFAKLGQGLPSIWFAACFAFVGYHCSLYKKLGLVYLVPLTWKDFVDHFIHTCQPPSCCFCLLCSWRWSPSTLLWCSSYLSSTTWENGIQTNSYGQWTSKLLEDRTRWENRFWQVSGSISTQEMLRKSGSSTQNTEKKTWTLDLLLAPLLINSTFLPP